MHHPPCGCHVCNEIKNTPVCCPPPKPSCCAMPVCPPPKPDCCAMPVCPPPKPGCCAMPVCPPPKPDCCSMPICPPPKPDCCAMPVCPPPKPDCCVMPVCPPPKPPKPMKTEGVLLQKIIACERRTIPCLCTELTLEGLCAQPPLTLTRVQQSGAQPWWSPLHSPHNQGQLPICVSIPVCAQVCDCCGQTHHASATVSVETFLRAVCSFEELARNTLLIVPCVRLICAEPCSDGCVFKVQLRIDLEIYLLRPEPFKIRCPESSCPDLPLYPPPIRQDRPCWPQCPTAQGPYGWPARD